MGDYIDRYSLLNDLKTSVVFSGRSGVVSSELKGANKVIDRIIEMPTADVQETKHGEWLKNEEKSEKHIEAIYFCSACRNYDAWGVEELTNYCPHCGAKMDGGDTV